MADTHHYRQTTQTLTQIRLIVPYLLCLVLFVEREAQSEASHFCVCRNKTLAATTMFKKILLFLCVAVASAQLRLVDIENVSIGSSHMLWQRCCQYVFALVSRLTSFVCRFLVIG